MICFTCAKNKCGEYELLETFSRNLLLIYFIVAGEIIQEIYILYMSRCTFRTYHFYILGKYLSCAKLRVPLKCREDLLISPSCKSGPV